MIEKKKNEFKKNIFFKLKNKYSKKLDFLIK